MSNEAVHVNQWGSVFFKLTHTEGEILEGLTNLRDENMTDEIKTFWVDDIPWTETICQEMIKTFQYHKDLGRHWEQADFSLTYETNIHVQAVLLSPVTMQLFRSFHFNCGSPMNSQMATIISFVLRSGRSVYISDCDIGQYCMSILSKGLATPDAPRDFSLECVCFSSHEDQGEERSAVQCLADRPRSFKALLDISL